MRHVKKMIPVTLAAILAFLLLVSCTGSSSYVTTGMSQNSSSGTWSLSAKTINGHITKNIKFTADELAALQVESTNDAGTVTLVLTQGDTTKTIDINGEYNETIDTAEFEPGRVSLRLNFEKTENVTARINWK